MPNYSSIPIALADMNGIMTFYFLISLINKHKCKDIITWKIHFHQLQKMPLDQRCIYQSEATTELHECLMWILADSLCRCYQLPHQGQYHQLLHLPAGSVASRRGRLGPGSPMASEQWHCLLEAKRQLTWSDSSWHSRKGHLNLWFWCCFGCQVFQGCEVQSQAAQLTVCYWLGEAFGTIERIARRTSAQFYDSNKDDRQREV